MVSEGSEQPQGTLQIIRPFAESVSTLVTEDVKSWIAAHERPTVYEFNDRTISQIFSEGGSAIVLFHSEDNQELSKAFSEAAEEVRVVGGKDIIFTNIPVLYILFRRLPNITMD